MRSLLLPFLSLSLVSAAFGQTEFPLTGREVPELLPYETAARKVMEKWAIPGAALAIVDGNRLIYARGLGYADREARQPVQPNSRFRLASISKTIAAMTLVKLAEEGRVNLDAPVLTLLPDLKQAPNPDPRMARVTVRQFLQHTGGFERDDADEPAFYYNTASRLFNEPISVNLMTRYILSQKLDFDPGTKFAYGNSGFQVLGRVIERVTGKPFMEAVYDKVLRPAGVTSVELGGNLLSQRKTDEVKYYDYPGAPLSTTVVAPGAVVPTPLPYNRRVDYADSYGGLIGNSVDMLRYLTALEGRRGPSILNAASLASITARPSVWPGSGNYTGLAWRMIPTTGGLHWWHSGGASGTRNLLVRRLNGRSWVILMNMRPQNEDQIITDLFDAFFAAEAQVKSWPTHDLFPEFSGPSLAASGDSLSFSHTVGAPVPASQSLQFTVAGQAASSIVTGTPVLVETPSENWLRVERLTGTTPFTLTVAVNPAGLAPGDYQAQLRVTAATLANSPRVVRVALRVSPAPVFNSIRNSASQAVVAEAAAGARITVEGEAIAPAGGGSLEAIKATLQNVGGAELPMTVVAAGPKFADLVIPAEAQIGEATLQLTTSAGQVLVDKLRVGQSSPGLFAASIDGRSPGSGAALAHVFGWAEDGSQGNLAPAFACNAETPENACVTSEIDFTGYGEAVGLRLASTGTRAWTDPAAYAIKIGEAMAEVVSITPADEPGMDWITVRLPRALAGTGGELDIQLTIGEQISNTVKIRVK